VPEGCIYSKVIHEAKQGIFLSAVSNTVAGGWKRETRPTEAPVMTCKVVGKQLDV
jgi:hypothetical protein